jgi:anthranilate phosphoribosyltransferase
MLDGEPSDEDIASSSSRCPTAARRPRDRRRRAGDARAADPGRAPANAIDVCGTGGDGTTRSTSRPRCAGRRRLRGAGGQARQPRGELEGGAGRHARALGLDLDRAMETAEATLADLGIGFLFAGKHHPAMGRIMPIRKALGRRTIFNLMGPLANPPACSASSSASPGRPTCRSTTRRSPGFGTERLVRRSRATRGSTS